MDWPSFLRALDKPVPPGTVTGLELPHDFDLATNQTRFGLLAERLGELYDRPLRAGRGPGQDAARFGAMTIPADLTRTREPRTGARLALAVEVSSFGDLATHRALPDYRTPTHPDDSGRIEAALIELDYLIVPTHILVTPYDGPNQWAFGDSQTNWYGRFFAEI